ncbi:MAG: DUF2617 family protein [Pirellula sp.]
MISIRPTLAEHALYVFGRSIHPELFSIFRSRSINRSKYSAKIEITSEGHLVTFVSRSVVMTEVVCSAHQLLPQKRRILGSNLKGKRSEQICGKLGVSYHTEFELERVSTEMFWMVHNQLQSSQLDNELVYSFDSSGRIAFGAVSYVHIAEMDRQLLVQAFHTFPDDCAIVKSISTFAVA